MLLTFLNQNEDIKLILLPKLMSAGGKMPCRWRWRTEMNGGKWKPTIASLGSTFCDRRNSIMPCSIRRTGYVANGH